MDMTKEDFLRKYKWHTVVVVSIIIVVTVLAVFTDVFLTARFSSLIRLAVFFSGIIVLFAILTLLSSTLKIAESLKQSDIKLERISTSLEKIRASTTQLNQNISLSEPVKSIAFRSSDQQMLQEVIFDKLQQQNFDETFKIIDDIKNLTPYSDLADNLYAEAQRYKGATNQERVNQIIDQIEKLLADNAWAKASAQIERLIKAQPESEKAKLMRNKLVEKKNERKKIILNAWDDAVKRQDTDRSLEILRELDMYLTPAEGLALQEAARDVFRTKLHNLGVQFALSVSEKRWQEAYECGQEIIKNFPNSRMAREIVEKISILQAKVQQI